MKIKEIRIMAKSQGIHPGKISKTGLIRMIQTEEGNFDCYGTAIDGECDQANCLWREDCFDAALEGEPS